MLCPYLACYECFCSGRGLLPIAVVLSGIYTFSVTPTVQIASRSDLWLPTNYGNIGSYTLEVRPTV
jgi:hypothetical protein